MNLGFLGKGNASLPAALSEQVVAGACGLKLHEDWGTTPAAIDSCLAVADDYRRPGGDPHRHAERIGLRRGHHRRLQGPHHPRLPHRRRRRRPRARHHQGRAAMPNVLPVLDQPDAALHGQHARRASRHADGLPPPRPAHPRGRGLRREPHPQGDHRRRGHPARPRRVLDDVVRQPGDGPRRRGDHPHLADRAQDEGAARPRCPEETGDNDNFRVKRYIAKYTINPAIAHGIAARGRLGRGRQARRPGAVVAGLLRRQARPGAEGRHASPRRRWATRTPRSRRRSRCTTGRCSAPSAAPGRELGRPSSARPRSTPASRRSSGLDAAAASRSQDTRSGIGKKRHDAQRRACRRSRSIRRPTRCAPTASC